MSITYGNLQERVGHYLFGVREDFTDDQKKDIHDCISDGLSRVYASHEWSFFRPVVNVTTYAGISELSMPSDFESVSNDSELAYYMDSSSWYPSVKQRGDQIIRKLQQEVRPFDRPVFYSVRTVTFDSSVGSRKVLAFFPTPDKAYTMRVPMFLRPVPPISTNLSYKVIGGEVLSQVIIEACLARAGHNFEERENVYEKSFVEMLALAIRNDSERSTPTYLGPDAPVTKYAKSGVFGYDYRTREQRIGGLTFNGDGL